MIGPSAVQRRRWLPKRQFKAESTRICFCLKADIFSSGFAYCPHASGENSHRKWIFSKNALQSGDFWKRRLFIYEWTDENRGFRIRWCHILLAWRMLRKWRYRIYIVVAFSWGQAKTIRIRYVRMRIFFLNVEKTLRFQKYPDTCGRGLNVTYRVFSHDVTAAILVSQTSPLGVELFSYANTFFCSNKFAYMLASWVKTLCWRYFELTYPISFNLSNVSNFFLELNSI